MRIATAHFGEVEIDDNKVLFFENGLPGLEDNKRFALLSNEESRPINWFQSLDHWEIALPVIDPFLVCDYAFDIPRRMWTLWKSSRLKTFMFSMFWLCQTAA